MKILKFYVDKAILVRVKNIPDIFMEDNYNDILSKVSDFGINIDEVLESDVYTDEHRIDLYFKQPDSEVEFFSMEVSDEYPKINLEEYISINKDMADNLNKLDVLGGSFDVGDEIKVSGITQVLFSDPLIINYRLHTYVVCNDVLEIDLNDTTEEVDNDVPL